MTSAVLSCFSFLMFLFHRFLPFSSHRMQVQRDIFLLHYQDFSNSLLSGFPASILSADIHTHIMVLELVSNTDVVRTASVGRSLKILDLYMAKLGVTH